MAEQEASELALGKLALRERGAGTAEGREPQKLKLGERMAERRKQQVRKLGLGDAAQIGFCSGAKGEVSARGL